MSAASHPRISAIDAARLMREEGYEYLDVRSPEEFLVGHPQGAYNIPWLAGGEAEFVRTVQSIWRNDQKLVVGCRTGNRSQLAAAALIAAGFTTIVEQRAGYAGVRDAFGRVTEPGWHAEGLPTALRPEPGHDHAALLGRTSSSG